MKQLVFIFAAFFLTCFGVEIFRRWTLRRKILDIPNERSSHVTPTPRGGGLIIVLVCLSFYAVYTIFPAAEFSGGYFAGAVLIALISWFDDIKSISSAARFLVHAVAAGLAIFSLGWWQPQTTGAQPLFGEPVTSWFGAAVTLLWIIWLTNAYNFMDGIDGIAGTQGLTAGIGWLLIGIFFNLEVTSFFGGALAAANLGFLLHNWQPAKIFMGDVGSAFQGYTFAVMPLIALKEAPVNQTPLMAAAVFLVWMFVFDTLFTFSRRVARGEKFWRAHRSHLYQRLVISGYSHRLVTILYGSFSISILAAVLLWLRAGDGFAVAPFMLAPLIGCGVIILCYRRENG
jgi:UDP-N-acetylmuramyl pentapeptide phosphotransferase/UDP-N-acetylglucosamine-1-phosphate transferase